MNSSRELRKSRTHGLENEVKTVLKMRNVVLYKPKAD